MKVDSAKIAVLYGGLSSERDVSINSGQAVFKALSDAGLDVSGFDVTDFDQLASMLKDIDVVFLALHGKYGEDGFVQQILEDIGIPYTGSGVQASADAFDKLKSKLLFDSNHVVIPKYVRVDKLNLNRIRPLIDWESSFVKPACDGSSIGVKRAGAADDVIDVLNSCFQYSDTYMVEEEIKGREITVGILDGQALPVIELVPSGDFYDYESKYSKGKTEYLFNPVFHEEIQKAINVQAIRAFNAVGARDMGRVDIIVDSNNMPHVLEVNTIPGFTETSLLPKAAKAAGYEFSELCIKLVDLAIRRGLNG